MRRRSLKTLRKYIPLYEQSTKIKEEDIESHDTRFHNQIKIFNVVLIIVYTVGVIMEFNSGIKGHYLIVNVFLILTSVTAVVLWLYSHFTNNIKLNYWIMIMMIIRMCFGLIQPVFSGLDYQIE